MLVKHAYELVPDDLFVQLTGVGTLNNVALKLKGCNPTGSTKVKAVRQLVAAAEAPGIDFSTTTLVAGDALQVANAVRCFTRATSLGGSASLIEHRFTFEGPGSRSPVNMLRLSIGLQPVDDLFADLDAALRGVCVSKGVTL